MNIILDANVIVSDFFLKSYSFRILFEFAEKTNSLIILPKIAFKEVLSKYKRELESELVSYEKANQKLNRLLADDNLEIPSIDIKKSVDLYEAFLLNKFDKLVIEKAGYKETYLEEVIDRAVNRKKPISQKGEEFRDALLWLSLLDFLKDDFFQNFNEGGNVFVSNNIRDFANKEKDDFHQDLKLELEQHKLHLSLFKTLSDFNNSHAIEIDFLNREWLLENIDWKSLNETVKEGAESVLWEFMEYAHYFHPEELKDDEIVGWKVLNVSMNREIPSYFVYESAQRGHYMVAIYFEATARVSFELLDEKCIEKNTIIQTSGQAEVQNQQLTSCSANYYSEESGFYIDWDS